MVSKKVNVIVWLMKSAEIDVIKQSCITNLVGLQFDSVYTMPYAMCLNAVEVIFSTLGIGDNTEIISTNRFCNVGLASEDETVNIQSMIASLPKDVPVNVGVWREVAKSYFEMSVRKAIKSINNTFAELTKMPGKTFTILVVNNDKLPLLELLAAALNKELNIPTEGEVLELRFERSAEVNKGNAKLVYASFHSVQ